MILIYWKSKRVAWKRINDRENDSNQNCFFPFGKRSLMGKVVSAVSNR